MHKITTTILLGAIFGFNIGSAAAIENNYRPYVGINYAYATAHADGYHSYHNAGSVNLGSVYNKYFGTELFYQYSDKHKFSSSENMKDSQFQAYGLDMMAYLPLGCDGKFAPTATMGIGEYTFKHNYRFSRDRRDHGWGYRFGGGLTYNIDSNWSARLLARYIKLDQIHNMDHISEYSFGVRYTFN